jgi:hypothetical protein
MGYRESVFYAKQDNDTIFFAELATKKMKPHKLLFISERDKQDNSAQL